MRSILNPDTCTADLRCPRCGQTDTFRIQVDATATVTADGVTELDSDNDWDDRSEITCPSCYHAATVADFTVR